MGFQPVLEQILDVPPDPTSPVRVLQSRSKSPLSNGSDDSDTGDLLFKTPPRRLRNCKKAKLQPDSFPPPTTSRTRLRVQPQLSHYSEADCYQGRESERLFDSFLEWEARQGEDGRDTLEIFTQAD